MSPEKISEEERSMSVTISSIHYNRAEKKKKECFDTQ
jgi:hypothetical protein